VSLEGLYTVNIWSKLLSISTRFFISTILGCVEGSYITFCPILSATVEKKELKAKVVRQCKVTVAQQLSSLINLSINTGVFPDSLKVAQVTPIHKKNDNTVATYWFLSRASCQSSRSLSSVV
jgi:hypothetical protein